MSTEVEEVSWSSIINIDLRFTYSDSNIVYNISNNDIRAANGFVFVDIVACISGRKLYAILWVSCAVSMWWPWTDRSVV